MKSILLLSFTLLLLATGCSVSKTTMNRKEILQKAKVDTSCFVLYKDGTFKTYKTLELKTSMVSVPYLLADGKIKIRREEIDAYQTEDYYAISQENYSKEQHSKLAIECLPGFAVRTAKGKLNIYERRCLNSTYQRDLFIQPGDNRPVFEYTPELMNSMIKYHYEAYHHFNARKGNVLKKIYTAARLYNHSPSYTSR